MKVTLWTGELALLSWLAIGGALPAERGRSSRGAFADMNPNVSCEHAHAK